MTIGFVAMSGVRACNKELTAAGLTLPGFVERSKVIASLPSLGLLTLAGMTPERCEMRYVEVPDLEKVTGLPGEFDLVAISSFSAQIKDAYRLADRYRAAGAKVVLGGLHVTALPDEAAQHADSVVLGEGELAWPQVVRDFERNALQPRYDMRGRGFDLGDSPVPRFELLDMARYNRLTVQTQRGCPFNCEFCAASIRLAPGFKTKPVPRVVAELRRIMELSPHPFIEFADDNTFADKRHGRELLRAMIPLGLRWFTETDISVAEDGELLRLMCESGCAQVLIGLESPGAAGLDGLELKSNWKLRHLDRYRAAIDRIQSHGITVNGCFVLGLDHTGEDSFDAIHEFVRESGLFEVQITVLTPFPGTPLYGRLLREGRLLHDGAWERCTLFDVNFRPQLMSASALERGLLGLAERLYSEEFTSFRRRRYVERKRALELQQTNGDTR
jgi:radical SAM superfamily enzyme YgiQ (UPF0313 family)